MFRAKLPIQKLAMILSLGDRTRDFIVSHRVARLATADAAGRPIVVPVCYVFDGERFYSAIDEKRKRVVPPQLKRVRNIQVNPQVSLVIDDYSEDWSKLGYVLAQGKAEILTPGGRDAAEHERAVSLLREKYPQYRAMAIETRPIIRITPTRIKDWRAQS